MKTWYRAVCDFHGEAIKIFVSNPSCTAQYLGDKDKEIQAWLSEHYKCSLGMIHSDKDLDSLWEQGWQKDYDSEIGRIFRKPRVEYRFGEPLAPCPFCQGEPEIERMGSHRCSSIISCTNCGAWVEANEREFDTGYKWNMRK